MDLYKSTPKASTVVFYNPVLWNFSLESRTGSGGPPISSLFAAAPPVYRSLGDSQRRPVNRSWCCTPHEYHPTRGPGCVIASKTGLGGERRLVDREAVNHLVNQCGKTEWDCRPPRSQKPGQRRMTSRLEVFLDKSSVVDFKCMKMPSQV